MAKPFLRVTAAIIEKDGCFLAALRPHGGENGNLFEFPGGKIKPGETPEACLKREIREELCIEIEVLEQVAAYVHEYATNTVELLAYRAQWLSGDLRAMEHSALRWIEPARFNEIKWSPADIPITKIIIDTMS